jgi:hypothetical protein
MNQWNEAYPTNLQELIAKCDQMMKQFERQLANPDCPTVADLYELRSEKRYVVQENWERAVCFDDQAAHRAPVQKDEEFKGLYAFREQGAKGHGKPLYLGISRNVKNRLKQHAWGKLHNEATFAYLMARTEGAHSGSRDSIHDTPEILKRYQERIRQYQVAILLEPNDYDLYFMEVYFAGKWKTPWNSFRTH